MWRGGCGIVVGFAGLFYHFFEQGRNVQGAKRWEKFQLVEDWNEGIVNVQNALLAGASEHVMCYYSP